MTNKHETGECLTCSGSGGRGNGENPPRTSEAPTRRVFTPMDPTVQDLSSPCGVCSRPYSEHLVQPGRPGAHCPSTYAVPIIPIDPDAQRTVDALVTRQTNALKTRPISAEDLDDPKKRRLPPLVSALGPLDMAEAHVRSALDGDDVDENLAEALEQIQHARREHDDLRGRALPTIDRGRLSEEELDRIERHIRSARHAEDIWTTPAEALAMIAEIRDRRRERATPCSRCNGSGSEP
jgi:hypothetical protein